MVPADLVISLSLPGCCGVGLGAAEARAGLLQGVRSQLGPTLETEEPAWSPPAAPFFPGGEMGPRGVGSCPEIHDLPGGDP